MTLQEEEPVKDHSENMLDVLYGRPSEPEAEEPTVEAILTDHADWMLCWWVEDYELWSPYFILLEETIVQHYAGWKRVWGMGIEDPVQDALRGNIWGVPAIEPALHAILNLSYQHRSVDEQIDPQGLASWRASYRLINQVLHSSASCVYNGRVPLWVAEYVVACWEQASEALGSRGPYEGFLMILRKAFDLIDDYRLGEQRLTQLSLDSDSLGEPKE